MKTVIVGAVAGGASAAARIRRLDDSAEIVMFERGGYISYANCGLPYYIGRKIKEEKNLVLNTPDDFKNRFNIDIKINTEVISVDTKNKKVLFKELHTGKTGEESYDFLVLSPGAKAVRPKLKGIESEKIFTVRNVEDIQKIKKYVVENSIENAVVIGGGFIGVEMAENLINIGSEVVLIEKLDQILAPFDYEMACCIQGKLAEKGIKLLLETEVKEFDENGKNISVVTEKHGKIHAQIVIMAAGTLPDTDFLKDSGIEMGIKNSISVDKHMMTSVKEVYAVGDAVEIKNIVTEKKASVMLAGPANRQGRVAADNICGLSSEYRGAQGSFVVKAFELAAASTGLNERQARNAGLNYDIAILCPPSHATYYPNSKNITMKVVFERESGKILGAQVIGEEGADKRCDVFASAIRANLTAYDLTELELCYAPPFSSAKDPVNMAGYLIENIISGRVKQIHYSDVDSLDKEKYLILDVRKDDEYNEGHIEGAYHIPLDSLRQRFGELHDFKEKTICICCKTGVRSYNAYRFLTQWV